MFLCCVHFPKVEACQFATGYEVLSNAVFGLFCLLDKGLEYKPRGFETFCVEVSQAVSVLWRIIQEGLWVSAALQ